MEGKEEEHAKNPLASMAGTDKELTFEEWAEATKVDPAEETTPAEEASTTDNNEE